MVQGKGPKKIRTKGQNLGRFLTTIGLPFANLIFFLILEKSSSKKWIFSLFQIGFLLPVKPAKINFEIDFCRLKIQFVELDFSNLIFQ